MGAQVLHFDDLAVVDRGTGVKTRLLVHKGLGSEHLTSGFTRFDPGAKIALHYHNCDESVVIAEGEAVCEIDGQRFPMKQWDTTYAPAGVPHRFLNESDLPMAILWIYAAGYVTRTFVETGVTVEHMSVDDKAVAPR
ncbi:MAG: cupin domain-containing protein [Chloroflexota bacterium]|nr:MAG: cupin domain-containing protein [Chloroflexota bacterium]